MAGKAERAGASIERVRGEHFAIAAFKSRMWSRIPIDLFGWTSGART